MAVVIAPGVGNIAYPRIGWRRITGTVTASTEATGYDGDRATNVETYDGWQPTALPATLEIDAGSSVDASYCGIAAHDLGTQSCTVYVELWDGAAWQEVSNKAPADDDALLFLFPKTGASKWRIRVTGAGSMPTIGHVAFGEVLLVPRLANYLGDPIDEAEQVTYRQNLSETGELLGRNVEGNGLAFEVTIDYLPESFRTDEWRSFRVHCDSGDQTFFIAPKPGPYPAEVAYAWCTEPPRVRREVARPGIAGSVTLQCRGYRAP